ncbi:hypothetical protein [Natrinema pallidum]|uniref:hypothetical protein n=1 Tax=Natrinema pallidum TaxID=69527 RepID=UPI003750D8DB
MTLNNQYLTEAAAKSEYTVEELQETAEKLEDAIQSRLHKHFKRCRLESGYNYWLLEDYGDSVWLAFNEFELQEEMRRADIEFDPGRLFTVASGYLQQFQSDDITLAVPGPVARSYEDPFFYPIRVRYPDGWDDGQQHTFNRFQELVWRFDLSPAEALDFWVVERMGQDAIDWSGKRGVQPEAVRKNVRQAREKVGNEYGASHERETLRVVRADEVPSGKPHDPDKDLFYVPTEVPDDEE